MADDFLTVADVAELLKMNQQTVRNWIDRGELQAVRIGKRRIRVRRVDLDAFIEAGMPPEEPVIEPDVDEQAVVAWAAFGAALTETTATLQAGERAELVRVLESLQAATRELAQALSSPGSQD